MRDAERRRLEHQVYGVDLRHRQRAQRFEVEPADAAPHEARDAGRVGEARLHGGRHLVVQEPAFVVADEALLVAADVPDEVGRERVRCSSQAENM